jgi:integrase
MVSDAKSEGRAETNIYKVRNYLSGLFSHLIRLHQVAGLETNSVRYVQLPAKSAALKPQLPAEIMLDLVAKKLPTMSSILFDCIRTFGARPGEVTALQWKHVDFNTNTIDIVQHVRDGDLQQSTKNKTTRRVDMTPQLARSLQAWKSISKYNGDEDWVFPARARQGSHMPVRYDNLLRRDLKRVCRELGVQGVDWKLLRHCFATAAVARGVDPVTLESIMGHRDIRTTYKYYAHVDEDVRKAWTLELAKRLYSSPEANKTITVVGCKARQHGHSVRFDDTVMTQVLTRKVAGKVKSS